MSIASPVTRPSPLFRRVGIRIITFEACSDFTHVTARWIAQPPKAAEYYGKLLALAKGTDSNRPEIARAHAFTGG